MLNVKAVCWRAPIAAWLWRTIVPPLGGRNDAMVEIGMAPPFLEGDLKEKVVNLKPHLISRCFAPFFAIDVFDFLESHLVSFRIFIHWTQHVWQKTLYTVHSVFFVSDTYSPLLLFKRKYLQESNIAKEETQPFVDVCPNENWLILFLAVLDYGEV